MFWFECEMSLIGSMCLNTWFLAAVLGARGTLKRCNIIGGSLSLRTGFEGYSLAPLADWSLLSLPRYEQESAYSHHHKWEPIFHPCLPWHDVLCPQNMILNKSSSLKLLLARYLVTVVRQVINNARGKQQCFHHPLQDTQILAHTSHQRVQSAPHFLHHRHGSLQ